MAFTPSLMGGSYSSGYDVLGTGNQFSYSGAPVRSSGGGGNVASGALGGAAAGASAGAVAGPWGAAIGGAIGGIGGALSSLFGGDGGGSSGYQIPVEFELPFIRELTGQTAQIQEEMSRLQEGYNAYASQLTALDSIIGGGDKMEGLRALQESNFRIAQSLGQGLEGLGQGVADPAFERQNQEGRDRLAQDLRRSGQSPAVIAQELARYDQTVKELRFQRQNEQLQARAGVLGTTAGFAGQALGALSTSAANRFGGLQQLSQWRQGLRQEQLSNYRTLGSFQLSDRTQQLLSEGAIGPGSIQSQVGARGGSYATRLSGGGDVQPLSTSNRLVEGVSANAQFNRMSDEQLRRVYQQRVREKDRGLPAGLRSAQIAAADAALSREFANRGLL